MSTKNCINCGAPIDIAHSKCSYCGTSYYDLSFLDFESGKPFALKIKTNLNGKSCYITQLVRARNDISINFSSDTYEAYRLGGNKISSMISNNNCTTNVSFDAVCLPGQKELIRIETE